MSRYIITGFSGFVSYFFLDYLSSVSDSQQEILGLDIAPPADFDKWHFAHLHISFQTINLLDKNAVSECIETFKPDFILHLAAISSVKASWTDPASCFTNNTEIFLNLAEALKKQHSTCRILCIGSSEEYGTPRTTGDLPFSEEMPPRPENPYAVTKSSQENLAKCYVSAFSLNILLTRSFNHIGPRQRDSFVVAAFCKQVAQASRDGLKQLEMTTGNLSVIRDFLDVRDVAKAYYLLLQKGVPGQVYNVCSGTGIPLKTIIDTLADISGIEIVTKTNPALLRPNDIPEVRGSNAKLSEATGWNRSFTLKETLSDIYEYWKTVI